jgi:precorrin-2 methylase
MRPTAKDNVMSMPATVSVIGVGPGDPELMTLRAVRVLGKSDLVLHPGPHDRSGFAFEVVPRCSGPISGSRGWPWPCDADAMTARSATIASQSP